MKRKQIDIAEHIWQSRTRADQWTSEKAHPFKIKATDLCDHEHQTNHMQREGSDITICHLALVESLSSLPLLKKSSHSPFHYVMLSSKCRHSILFVAILKEILIMVQKGSHIA